MAVPASPATTRKWRGCLRRAGKPVVVAVNKAEGREAGVINAEFHRMGFADVQAIAALNGQGCEKLLARALSGVEAITEDESGGDDDSIRIAVIGRPTWASPR